MTASKRLNITLLFQFQALENMLGRHLEGVMDAVLEMVDIGQAIVFG